MKLCLGIFALNLLLFPFDLAQAGNCTHHLHQVGELDEWKAWVKSLENNSSFLKAERKDRRWLEKWAKSTGSLARTSETWSGSLEVRRSDEILTAFRNARGSIVQIGNYISGLNPDTLEFQGNKKLYKALIILVTHHFAAYLKNEKYRSSEGARLKTILDEVNSFEFEQSGESQVKLYSIYRQIVRFYSLDEFMNCRSDK